MATEHDGPLVGRGAPANSHWESCDFDIKPANQAVSLRDSDSVTLYRIKPQLSSKEDFEAWEKAVQRRLASAKLLNLIDINIEKPMRNTDEAINWMNLSTKVLGGLADSISPALNKEIENRSRGKKCK